jgi:hypothetical protein
VRCATFRLDEHELTIHTNSEARIVRDYEQKWLDEPISSGRRGPHPARRPDPAPQSFPHHDNTGMMHSDRLRTTLDLR